MSFFNYKEKSDCNGIYGMIVFSKEIGEHEKTSTPRIFNAEIVLTNST